MDFRDSQASDMSTDTIDATETTTGPIDSKSVKPRPYPVEVDHSRDALLTDFGKETLNDRYLLPGESYQDLFVRVASAYGVDHRLKREEAARQREGAAGSGGGVPASGWRRATELEEKLAASERDAAASRLQVGLLREEVRRKGTR